MKKTAFILFFIIAIASCGQKKTALRGSSTAGNPATAADSLHYQYDSVKVYSQYTVTGYGRNDTTRALAVFPVFAEERMNRLTEQAAVSLHRGDEKYTSYRELANGFVKRYDAYRRQNKEPRPYWFMDMSLEVKANKPNYLSVLCRYTDYTGGAHPNTVYTYLNYDLPSGREIKLDSLIRPGAMTQLVALAEKIFRKNEGLTETQSLADHYFFENNMFALANTFTVSNRGLEFLYNPYEIKAYAAGTTTLLIPFSSLKDLARPGSILAVVK